MIPDTIKEKVSEALGNNILNERPLGGGCIHHAHRIETKTGPFFIKWNHPDQKHNFEVEQKGLKLLADSQAIKIPVVIASGETEEYVYLVLEYIEQGKPGKVYWSTFGRNLAQLHSHSHDQFGLSYDNYIGALPQPNGWKDSWIDFFIVRRILPMLQQATQLGRLPKGANRQFETLFQKLENFFPKEPSSLLHGDLWGGNMLVDTNGQPVIFDPAVYYGHREMELAFMTLFDRQPKEFYDAYQEVKPLASGWKERLDLYNLYPLLVHVILFGSSYTSSVMGTLKRYG